MLGLDILVMQTDSQQPKTVNEAPAQGTLAALTGSTRTCAICDALATMECEWGLYEVGGTPIYATDDRQKKKVLRIEGATPRTEPMQKSDLCGKCSDSLWLQCAGAVNAGLMHWRNSAVAQNVKAKIKVTQL
jgi:hypothetical protein